MRGRDRGLKGSLYTWVEQSAQGDYTAWFFGFRYMEVRKSTYELMFLEIRLGSLNLTLVNGL